VVEHSIGSRTDLNEAASGSDTVARIGRSFSRSERRSGTCIIAGWGPPDCAFYLTTGGVTLFDVRSCHFLTRPVASHGYCAAPSVFASAARRPVPLVMRELHRWLFLVIAATSLPIEF